MVRETTPPEIELRPGPDDSPDESGAGLMTRDEALFAAQTAFLAAERAAQAAMAAYPDRDDPRRLLADALDSLAHGLKLFVAVERGNVAGD